MQMDVTKNTAIIDTVIIPCSNSAMRGVRQGRERSKNVSLDGTVRGDPLFSYATVYAEIIPI